MDAQKRAPAREREDGLNEAVTVEVAHDHHHEQRKRDVVVDRPRTRRRVGQTAVSQPLVAGGLGLLTVVVLPTTWV